METYEPNQTPTSDKEECAQNRKGPFFRTSELNETTPVWKKVTLFVTGFLGLQVIAMMVQIIVMMTPLFDKEQQNFTILGQTLVNFISYILLLALLLVIVFIGQDRMAKKVIRPFRKKETYLYGLLAFFVILLINIIFSYLSNLIPDSSSNANQTGIESMMNAYPILVILMTVIIAPICEELTYRAGLLDLLGRRNRLLGILISSLIFGLIHFDYTPILKLISPDQGYYQGSEFIRYTAEQLANLKENYLHAFYIELINFPVYLLSGITLAFAYCYTGHISTSMFAHFLVNAFSALSFFLSKTGGNSSESIFRIFLK